MKALLLITAIVEAPAGLALLAAPSTLTRLLVGGSLDAPAAVAVARIAGAALVAVAITCWSAREDIAGRASRGIIAGVLLYNCLSVAVLVHTAAIGLRGVGLWPTAVLHAALAVWCLACLGRRYNAA